MTGRRHPVLWPKMKIRGWRRRTLASARHTYLTVVPYAMPKRNPDGSTTFTFLTAYQPGSVRIESRTVKDGFGRVIR